MAAISRLLLFILAALPLTIYLTDSWVPSCFIFEPSRLQEICKKNIAIHGNDIKPLMKDLVLDLQREYGPTVQDYDDARWVFNVAGGSTVCSVFHAFLLYRRSQVAQSHDSREPATVRWAWRPCSRRRTRSTDQC